MRTLLTLCLAILASCISTANTFAEVLPKDVIEVRNIFDRNGATSCSKAMADTINFLADGRTFTYNALWGNTDTNKKPITLDFLISGNKVDYSSSGSIILIPIGGQCVGAYETSFVAPSHDCKTYIHNIGADGKGWIQNTPSNNGDGGTAYFQMLRDNSNIVFIFNDVAGGCSVMKREMLNLNAQK